MAVNKVVFGNEVIVDLTGDNVTPEKMLAGTTAHDKTGAPIDGAIGLIAEDAYIGFNDGASWDNDANGIEVVFNAAERIALEAGVRVVQYVRGDMLGDAMDEDVTKGKTYTSANGLKRTGKKEESTGGGLPSGVSVLAAGTVTPTEDNASGLVVTHNLGVVPNFCAWYVEDDYSGTVATTAAIAGAIINKKGKYTASSSITYNIHYLIAGYGSSGQQTTTSGRVSNTTYLTTTNARLVCNSSYPIKAGKRIRWVVGVADGVL